MISKALGLGKRGAELLTTLSKAGIIRPVPPGQLLTIRKALKDWGPTPPSAAIISAARYGDEPAVIDELGTLTFTEVNDNTNRLANAMLAAGLGEESRVAILCRNHRGFIYAYLATLKIGGDALLLNTAFAGPQLINVMDDQGASAVIMDEEYTALLGDGCKDRPTWIAWHDSETPSFPTIEQIIASQSAVPPTPPSAAGRTIILTSGTTGKPKGAKRSAPKGLGEVVGVLSKIPFRNRNRMLISAPLFHAWGLGNYTAGLPLNATVILRRNFNPEDALATIASKQAEAMAVVPVMLQRILELPQETIDSYDTSTLNVVAASGSALPGALATQFMDQFGDVLYNLYGSTEVAWATIATPEDMRAAAGTAGKAPTGTTIRIVDDKGNELPTGQTGRIYVGHPMLFEGYTGDENFELIAGLVGTGDLGHMDSEQRLFIDGRADEMIVSGGENVYPIEVEDVIARHALVVETAVIGVDDKEFGERLKAFVVAKPGTDLDEATVKQYVKENLARYKVPREVVFMDELPRNATGKILKRELQEH
ncbi:MAG: AMP-binding protein [Thermoleophilaceae bacterium]|nr:AMP-binding protein [Thermoleophilaceae bacterium]